MVFIRERPIALEPDGFDTSTSEALRLPVDERAGVAAELIRSLDAEDNSLPADEVERRWAEEITRRAERASRGQSIGRDATEVLSAIESTLRQR